MERIKGYYKESERERKESERETKGGYRQRINLSDRKPEEKASKKDKKKKRR